MADYRDFCSQCGAVTNFGGTHSDYCTLSPRHEAWKAEQQFKKAVEGLDYSVRRDWMVCQFCFCLVEASIIAARTHRRLCYNPYVAGNGESAQDIKDLING